MEPASTFSHRGMDLRHYWRLFRKRYWLIILIALVSLVLGLIQGKRTRPMYQATAKLIIEQDSPKQVPFKDVIAQEQAWEYYQTQLRLLQSHSLARRVIDTLELHTHPSFASVASTPGPWQTLRRLPGSLFASFMHWFRQPSASDAAAVTAAAQAAMRATPNAAPDADLVGDHLGSLMRETAPDAAPDTALVKRFLSHLVAQSVAATQLVNLRFTSHDPQLAAEVTNTLARLFIDQSRETRFAASQASIDWLTKRVSAMRQKVEATQLALQYYKEEHQIFSIDDRLPGVMQELAALNASFTEARKERIGLEILYKELHRALEQPEMMEWMPAVVENSLIQTLKSNYVDLQRAFSQVEKKYGVDHPRVVELRSQMDSVKQKIGVEIRKIVRGTKAKYEVTKAREAAHLVHVEKSKREAQELNKKAIRYGMLKRDAESNRQLYDILLTRLKETSINMDFKRSDNIRIVDLAEVPSAPINIHPMRTLLTAGLVGLMLGVSVIVVCDFLDTTLKTPTEAEEFLGLPVLGVIEQTNRKQSPNDMSQVRLVTLREPHSQAAEAFKTLRTNLLFGSQATPRKVFLVTSSGPKEGKTMVAANLAVVLEQTGRRVLLVDSDLRRPSLHTIFDTSNNFGLSDLLSTDNFEPRFEAVGGNLTLVPSGTPASNPLELLSMPHLQRFIAFAREQYDTVILDSPPILAVSDAVVLNSLVDGVIFVLKSGAMTRDRTRRALGQLVSLHTEPLANDGQAEDGASPYGDLGLVMNFVDPHEGYYVNY